ncbi:MAG: hypothetical protein WBB74_07495 [Gaiellaceae bacterium]
MVTVLRLLGITAVTASFVASCGSGSHPPPSRVTAIDQSAARFVVGVDADLRSGKFPHAWRSLHPAQKRVVTAPRLATCYPSHQLPPTVTFVASKVATVAWTVPGTTRPTQAKEVTVTAKSRGRVVDTFVQHVVRVGDRWAWMMSRAFFRAAKRGAC